MREKRMIQRKKARSILWIAICILVLLPLVYGPLDDLQAKTMQQTTSKLNRLYVLNENVKSSNQQNISLIAEKEPLLSVLKRVAQKVRVGLSYQKAIIPEKNITVHIEDTPVFQALKIILSGTGLKVVLPFSRDVLVIKKRQLRIEINQETISGVVTDAQTGEPVVGANVLVVGTSTGDATDVNGYYTVTVPSLEDTLRFSYIGYQTKIVPIAGRTSIDIELEPATESLQELVVIGFGRRARRNITGSVASIDMETVETVQASTFNQKLQGKISGLFATTTSGRLGAPVKINIRGTSSINASNQPLYVLDGVPLINNTLGSGGGVYGANSPVNPFINLNSANIASIEVLKGAAATAIYGTRGSNGVILITTKSGSQGQPRLNINISGGIGKPANTLNLLNCKQYVEVYNYKFKTTYDASNFVCTNWQDVISRTGSFQQINASLTGGSENTTYHFFVNYQNSKGVAVSNDLEKLNANLKVNYSFNERLNVGLSVSPSVTYYGAIRANNQVGSAFTMAFLEPPVVPVYLPNGELNDGRDPSAPANVIFSPFPGTPYSNLKGMDFDNTTKQVITMVELSYDFLTHLNFNSQFSYQFIDNILHTRLQDYTVIGYPNGVVGTSIHAFSNLYWKNTLEYQKDWENSSISVLLGVTFSKYHGKNSSLTKRNIPTNSLKTINSASNVVGAIGSQTSYAFQNNVLRIAYDYKDKYLLTLTGSYNGTSRFPSDERYGFFPSIGAGWIISAENFMDSFNALSFLKLRTSYGVVGNANIENFEYQSLLTAGVKYFNRPGLAFTQLANYNLTWETTTGFDIALDYGFFNGRLAGSIGFYYKITNDLLLRRRISNVYGFTSIFKNGGKLMNKGIEFNVEADIIQTTDFRWNISGNISTLSNKVLELPGGQIINTPNIIREGEPIAAFYMPVYVGADPQNGDALYADGNGGTTSNYAASPRKIVGYPQPDFFGGFGTNLSFKGFDLNIHFTYTYGNELYWAGGEYLLGGTSVYNRVFAAYDYWTPKNKDAANPEVRLAPNGSSLSSRYLEDGSYLRLQSLQIGYTFPNSLFNNVRSVRIYLGGTNLLIFDNFPGISPTVTTSYTSNISQGVVLWSDPPTTRITAGIQVRI